VLVGHDKAATFIDMASFFTLVENPAFDLFSMEHGGLEKIK